MNFLISCLRRKTHKDHWYYFKTDKCKNKKNMTAIRVTAFKCRLNRIRAVFSCLFVGLSVWNGKCLNGLRSGHWLTIQKYSPFCFKKLLRCFDCFFGVFVHLSIYIMKHGPIRLFNKAHRTGVNLPGPVHKRTTNDKLKRQTPQTVINKSIATLN